jgi:pyruvate ferredoxin oxidoreductase alpha subunit
MVGLDGFAISHTLENVNVLPEETVKLFVGERVLPMVRSHEGKNVPFKLDPDNPLTMGPNVSSTCYFEFKRQQEEAMKNALKKIQDVNTEYAALTGRSYGDGLVDPYKLDDAEIAIVVIGSTTGTLKDLVDILRDEGIKAGLLRLRTFRPFPVEQLQNALKHLKAVAILDKSMSFGALGGPIFAEVRNALFDLKQRPLIVNYIFGLGGRDNNPVGLRKVFENLQQIAKTGQVDTPVYYLGLKE